MNLLYSLWLRMLNSNKLLSFLEWYFLKWILLVVILIIYFKVDELTWFFHDLVVLIKLICIIEVTICKLLLNFFVRLVFCQLRRTVFIMVILLYFVIIDSKNIDYFCFRLLVYSLLYSLNLIIQKFARLIRRLHMIIIDNRKLRCLIEVLMRNNIGILQIIVFYLLLFGLNTFLLRWIFSILLLKVEDIVNIFRLKLILLFLFFFIKFLYCSLVHVLLLSILSFRFFLNSIIHFL